MGSHPLGTTTIFLESLTHLEKLEFLMRTISPIFIVGSPRSGTSILSWCLGQHANIFVQEESSWMGLFALHIEMAYQTGTARGERSQLSALGVQREDFFSRFGDSINSLILEHRTRLESAIDARLNQNPPADGPSAEDPSVAAFKITRSTADPKARWVDGTPEYSFYTNPLRKLFPEARFVHMVRDVTSVVRSMMNFERTGGPPIVATEQQAYDYWLRTVHACSQAERAYGSDVVLRIRHSDLIDQPETTMKRVLLFFGEDFEPGCLEPLRKRINSSQVPSDFDPTDPKTDPAIIRDAQQLSLQMMEDPLPLAPDKSVASEIEDAFRERVKHISTLQASHRKRLERIKELQKELDEVKRRK